MLSLDGNGLNRTLGACTKFIKFETTSRFYGVLVRQYVLVGNVSVDGQCLSCIYRGVVVDENGMNRPLTMVLKEKLKDLKSCHF